MYRRCGYREVRLDIELIYFMHRSESAGELHINILHAVDESRDVQSNRRFRSGTSFKGVTGGVVVAAGVS
eukprot:1176203-Prorocentrum_minimum.AAC.1